MGRQMGRLVWLQDASISRPPRPVPHVRPRRLADTFGVLGPRANVARDLLPPAEFGAHPRDMRERPYVVAPSVAMHEVWRQLVCFNKLAYGRCDSARRGGGRAPHG